MKFVELKKSLQKLESAYLICGDDRFLCYNALEQIVSACNLSMPDINRIDMESPSADDILANVNIYPFVDEKRVVVVHDYAPKSAQEQEKKKIENYLSKPMETTVLVLFNLDDSTFAKKLAGVTIVDCNKLDVGAVQRYIIRTLAANNIAFDDAAANLLGLYCLYDMQKVTSELNKLISYLAGGERLSTDVVKEMVVQEKEYQVYSLAEMLAKNQAQSALDLVETLSQKGSSGLLSALYTNYRRLLYVAVTKGSDAELANKLGIKEFAVKMLKNQLGVFSPRKIKQIVDELSKYDADIKQGRIKENIAVRMATIDILKIRNT